MGHALHRPQPSQARRRTLKSQPTARDVVVLDEAGMVGSRQLAALLRRVRDAGAKLVLVGDPEQLQAIEAGAAFRAVVERVGAAEITTVVRQRVGWQRAATVELASGRTTAALARYRAGGMVHGHLTDDAAMAAVVRHWDKARQAGASRIGSCWRTRGLR